jgi:phosphoribosylamine--glycine ligase
MNVLILGSGAREHALALACATSSRIDNLFVAPGNPGSGNVARNVALDVTDHEQVGAFCREQLVDLVIVGPEAPLVAGIVDDLTARGIACFGPTAAAAKLEGSKGFAKDFCREFGIPTAEYRRFQVRDEAKVYIRWHGAPIVVKADGLAGGKGVIVARTIDEGLTAIDTLLPASGPANAELVIEEFLEGQEVSFFALCDGITAVPFSSAQDHKRVGDGDVGPNTGGMGAYSPPSVMTPQLTERVMTEIVMPTVQGMGQRGSPFRGVLFAGLMINEEGPKLIEYNVRFGDPEAEVILPRMTDDLLPLLEASAKGSLSETAPRFHSDTAVAVVMAARGYPGNAVRGNRIRGIKEAERVPGVSILHAGTRKLGDEIISDGGRVLTVTAVGKTVSEARDRAYAAVDNIEWPEGFCRRDIAWREIASERGTRP